MMFQFPYTDIAIFGAMRHLLTFLLLAVSLSSFSQSVDESISKKTQRLNEISKESEQILDELEALRLKWIREQLDEMGYPKSSNAFEVIRHLALTLGYSEKDEQAAWVQHIVIPEVEFANVSRTNDFRIDSLVSTGSAKEEDYFLKKIGEDGTMEFDGFGYDRGHLAPSADFRWSQKALSESYYYSNMSPQKPEFNRERWAELESWVRTYVIDFDEPVFVVTGPILKDGLKQQGEDHVSIPQQFYKIILDVEGAEHKAVAFLMPNEHCAYPVSGYVTSIDTIEKLTGLDFFSSLDDAEENKLEAMNSLDGWVHEDNSEFGEVAPLKAPLPKGYFNTLQAKYKVGEKTKICGTVVAAKRSRKDAVYLNFDQKYPRNVFYASIWKNNQNNFSYDPEKEFLGKIICVEGKVELYNDQARISVNREEQVSYWEDVIGEKD
ncbi:MAG: DNA/RNA non-specific endonuclease [Flavobacteriales bacterium]|nr:DNA/RNA non-specific endonuclease [Flavobacteriales bacterium]